jgi:aminomethyltransferase
MAPFAGFSMPIQYSGIRQEHEAVRTRAGLFDVSHMGNFTVKGPGALGARAWVS